MLARHTARAQALLPSLRSGLFINGSWVEASSDGRSLPVEDPVAQAELGRVAAGSAEDVDAAVSAAKAAGDTWAATSPAERAATLRRVAGALAGQRDKFASVEALNTGKPLREAQGDVDEAIRAFNYCAVQAKTFPSFSPQLVPLPDDGFAGALVYEPCGVVAGITPWNYPLMMASWKIAPALAAGCTTVMKPSEVTPYSMLELAACLPDAGVPLGVVNVVPGDGATGQHLIRHPDVAKVSFTGSVPTGTAVMAEGAATAKSCTLELGGKSPALVFGDAHVRTTVEWLLFGSFWNCGQICSATSRVLLHRSVADAVLAGVTQSASNLSVGGPFEDGVHMGPVVYRKQWEKVQAYIQSARDEGANVVCGGGDRPAHLSTGYFLPPTVITDVTPDMTVWKEEIFGPVMLVTVFDDEAEAVELANDTTYGLAAAVFSEDQELLRRVSLQLKAGIVWENTSQPAPTELPWGGYKHSGVGREMGPNALLPFLEAKSIVSTTARDPVDWFPLQGL